MAFLTLAGIAGVLWLQWEARGVSEVQGRRQEALAKEVADLRRVVQLLRFERGGRAGPSTLIEQLAHWAPKLHNAQTPAAEIPEIQRRVNDLLEGLEACGSDAWPALHKAFGVTRAEHEDDLRHWLLVAMLRVDRARGTEMLARAVRGVDLQVTPRLRLLAADELIKVDKGLAGRVLHEVLNSQSAAGLNTSRMPPEVAAKLAPEILASAAWTGFFNLIPRYVATGDADTVPTLLAILGRSEHDLTTLQECVKQLGTLQAKDAVPRIQELFANPPQIPDNPIFKNHCLDAIVAIEGAAARPWLTRVQREERLELVQKKLADLLK